MLNTIPKIQTYITSVVIAATTVTQEHDFSNRISVLLAQALTIIIDCWQTNWIFIAQIIIISQWMYTYNAYGSNQTEKILITDSKSNFFVHCVL